MDDSLRTHHHRKFCCNYVNCSKKFLTKGGLQLHSKTHYPEKFLLKCFDCDFTSFQKGNMTKHLATVHRRTLQGQFLPSDFQCTICFEKFQTDPLLKTHLLRKHTAQTEKPYKCQLCEYTAVERSDLRKHIRIIHTGERPYACEFCEFRTHTASGIARHRRGHSNSKPFGCNLCAATFADKKRLTSHLMKHNAQKPYHCIHCQYSTNRKDNLKTHVTRNHLETASATIPPPTCVQITTEANPYAQYGL